MSKVVLKRELPRWLEPATTGLTEATLDGYVNAIEALGRDLESHEFDLVHAATARFDDDARAWLGTAIRHAVPTFVAEGKDALLSHIACAVLLGAADMAPKQALILSDLAIESASATGLNPAIGELATTSSERLKAAAHSARTRTQESVDLVALARDLPKERAAEVDDEGEEVPVDPTKLAGDVFALRNVVESGLKSADRALRSIRQQQAGIDEEVEVLWWALHERSDSGAPWTDLDATERAARGAEELASRTLVVPGLPSSRYFLGRLLGADRTKPVAFRDFVRVVAENTKLASAHDRLLPLAATVGCLRDVDGDDSLWPGLATKKFGIDVTAEFALEDAASQLYREFQMQTVTTP